MDLKMTGVDSMMKDAVSSGIFPGGSILVSMWGETIFRGDYGWANIYRCTRICDRTLFDLASLTKPLVTALCTMKLVRDGALAPGDRIGSVLSGFRGIKKEISLLDLLCHRSGLPAHRPFYELLSSVCPRERKKRLADLLLDEPLDNPPGKETVYSDLGFMILRMVIEEVSGKSLKECFNDWIVRDLGLKDTFLYETGPLTRPVDDFAATEDCPFRRRVIQGETHDLNAFFSGGHDGQAGLFATMDDVNCLIRTIAGVYKGHKESGFCDPDTVRLFFDIPDGYDRALGFDVPSKTGSSSGRFFSDKTVGHLGYTGTSFWMDLETGLCVVLLTNRVHPTALNISIRQFRPRIHDCVATAVFG